MGLKGQSERESARMQKGALGGCTSQDRIREPRKGAADAERSPSLGEVRHGAPGICLFGFCGQTGALVLDYGGTVTVREFPERRGQ